MRRSKKLPKKQSVKPTANNDDNLQETRSNKNLSELETKTCVNNSDSSSESDIESYLKPASQIDLDSSFFQTNKPKETTPFEAIEKNIFSGINRLSDLESDPEENEIIDETTSKIENAKPTTSKINFRQLYDYTKKIEDAKKLVEVYERQRNLKQNKAKCKNTDADELKISELLALGETKVDSFVKTPNSLDSNDLDSLSDSEKDDWEEVEETNNKDVKDNIIPEGGVQITVELPGLKQKKKGIDLLACMKRRLNRVKKENQIYIHKVHLLCWIAHGNYVNQVLNDQDVLSLALSLIPSQHCYPSNRTDLTYLEQIVRWYRNSMPVKEKLYSKDVSLIKLLRIQIKNKQVFDRKMLVYIFICMLRSLGIQCRLVISFQVAPLRPPASELHSLSTKTENERGTTNKANKLDTLKVAKNSKCGDESIKKSPLKQETSKKQKNSTEKIVERKKDHFINDSNVNRSNKSSKPNKDGHARKSTKPKTNLKVSSTNIPQLDGADDIDKCVASTSQNMKKPNLKNLNQEKKEACSMKKVHTKRLKSIQSNKKESVNNNKPEYPKASDKSTHLKNLKRATKSTSVSDVKSTKKKNLEKSQYFSSDSSLRSRDNFCNDIISIMKGRIAEERAVTRTKLVKSVRHKYQNDYDSDYAPEPIKKRRSYNDNEEKVKVKRRVKINKDDDDDDEEKKKKQGVDVWVEVFLESEERWISADVVTGNVHCVRELYSRATHPVTYIIAWNNNNSLKDITQRYCRNWNTVTRKLRIDKKWLQNTLKPFEGQKTIRDKEEDEELAKLQLEQPLPTSIAEYKNHPLYVLKRHLLKFQALYPPEPITLGFIKDEPVYSRDCVHTLHSREVWIKYAKVVKRGEEPYKIVKARSKYDKLSGQMITDKPLELFGKWQVEDYIPPTAENGIVPRNAFGNVELFKSCMLPKGTVHLQLPGLNKVAKKLNIDCAPAVVGFDFHSGGSHPTFDGFVICEEHTDILVAAWYTEQEEQEKREQEKIEKRVYDNWKKLIKGLLIRERLKARYDFGDAFGKGGKKRKSKGLKLITKKRRMCSGSESD